MNDQKWSPAQMVFGVVIAVILLIATGLTAWTASKVVCLSETVAGLTERVNQFEARGSPIVQTTVADLREIKVTIASLKEGQARMEEVLKEHIKKQ